MSLKKFTAVALLIAIPAVFTIQSCGTVVNSKKTKKRLQKDRSKTAKKKRNSY
ncbi:MAG: hypothetical protein KAG64_05650 [Bacteroidales bacterium]|nr:hypothetical protein [Bacteroidales bacterium]